MRRGDIPDFKRVASRGIMKKKRTLTISRALENLSYLAENDILEDSFLEPGEDKKTLIEKYSRPEEIYNKAGNKTVVFVKDTFNIALQFVRELHAYQANVEDVSKNYASDIIHMVGEAAEEITRSSNLFRYAYKGCDELDNLLYSHHLKKKRFSVKSNTRLAKKVEGVRQTLWGSSEKVLCPRARVEHQSVNDVLLSIEDIKRDYPYELLYLKRDDGTRFFENKVGNLIKLDGAYRDYEQQEFIGNDPFTKVRVWHDRGLCSISEHMLNRINEYVSEFYRQYPRYKEHAIVQDTHFMLMALKLSAQRQLLLENSPKKSCYEYFLDFLHYLRQVLQSRDYQNYINHPPKKGSFFCYVLDFIHTLCFILYTREEEGSDSAEVIEEIEQLAPKSNKKRKKATLTEEMSSRYQALSEVVSSFPNGPLFKMLDYLQTNFNQTYDPIQHINLPQRLFNLSIADKEVALLRLPSPTSQEYVSKAELVPEFIGFLRAYQQDSFQRKHLMVNLQGRLNWLERARSQSIEELQRDGELSHSITVLSLVQDSDFVHQRGPYTNLQNANTFMRLLLEKVRQEEGQYFLPKAIQKQLNSTKLKQIANFVHRFAFEKKSELMQKERQCFIEMFYFICMTRLLVSESPNSFSFTCKDAVDHGMARSFLFYTASKLLVEMEQVEFKDVKRVWELMLSPSLLVRERVLSLPIYESCMQTVAFFQDLNSQLNDNEALKNSYLKELKDIIGVDPKHIRASE